MKTGRRPGDQPGHKGHCHRKYVPTETHELPVYYETGKIIRKQWVVIEMSVKVIEYTAKEYRSLLPVHMYMPHSRQAMPMR